MNKRILTCCLFVLTTFIAFSQPSVSEEGYKLDRTIQLIQNLYVEDVNSKKLTETAIRAMLQDLDPHSTYLTEEEVRQMNEPLIGNFEGIGISFNLLTDTLYVVDVISGGPSQKVGIHPGDKILYVNDTLIAGVKMKNKDIMGMLRGKKGTTVDVKVRRNGVPELLEFKITRDVIPIYSIDAAYMLDANTGYIRLSRFGFKSDVEFRKALTDLQKKGMKNLIFDLTGNGGGLLQVAAEIADEFLTDKRMIVYTEGKNQPRYNLKATRKGNFHQGKLVIMVDEGSASASEIMAGTVQDWDRGVIVGRRTFGKGLVQRQLPLTDGSMIRLTVARYYTPSGRCIQKPYKDGNQENYYADFIRRMEHGEMQHADSIHFPDSLKYKTLTKLRNVYGGGGIMPDYFVPLDTMSFTPLLRSLTAKGVVQRVTIAEVDNHRKELKEKYPDADAFKLGYTVSDKMFERVKKMAAKEKIEWKEDEFNLSKELLRSQLKAIIARDLYGEAGYFKVMNEQNEIFIESMRIINDDTIYNRMLEQKMKL